MGWDDQKRSLCLIDKATYHLEEDDYNGKKGLEKTATTLNRQSHIPPGDKILALNGMIRNDVCAQSTIDKATYPLGTKIGIWSEVTSSLHSLT